MKRLQVHYAPRYPSENRICRGLTSPPPLHPGPFPPWQRLARGMPIFIKEQERSLSPSRIKCGCSAFSLAPRTRKWLVEGGRGSGNGGRRESTVRRLTGNERKEQKQAAFIWYDKGVRGEGRRAAVMDSAYETDVPSSLLGVLLPTSPPPPSPEIALYVCERVATPKRAGRKQAARWLCVRGERSSKKREESSKK